MRVLVNYLVQATMPSATVYSEHALKGTQPVLLVRLIPHHAMCVKTATTVTAMAKEQTVRQDAHGATRMPPAAHPVVQVYVRRGTMVQHLVVVVLHAPQADTRAPLLIMRT